MEVSLGDACCICGILTKPKSGRRIISSGSGHCYRAYTSIIKQEVSFTSNVYSCKQCYSQLERISRHQDALTQMLQEVEKLVYTAFDYPSYMYVVKKGIDASTQTEDSTINML